MLADFKNLYKGDTCVVIGNGPSLDETPLEELAAKYKAFGANKIYDSACHPDFQPDFWSCCDTDMLHDCLPWILEHPEFTSHKFVPREFAFPGANTLNVAIGRPISTDAAEYVALGGTVTVVNLQLAYYMGFTTALLVGVDHRYPKRGHDGAPGTKFIGDGDDPGHFKSKTGAYFSKGRIYNRPELDATASISYPAARRMFEKDGRKVINLTPGSALDVFEKGSFKQWT